MLLHMYKNKTLYHIDKDLFICFVILLQDIFIVYIETLIYIPSVFLKMCVFELLTFAKL